MNVTKCDAGCNLKHTLSKDILTDLESMLCFNAMPQHAKKWAFEGKIQSLRRTIIGRPVVFEIRSSRCKWI